jgi:hypothetical protein
MSNYAVEIIQVATPTGIKPFITNRTDYRSEEALAREVPRYFNEIRGLGDGHYFVSRAYFAIGLTKAQGEEVLSSLLVSYDIAGSETLNAKNAPGKDRTKLEAVVA